MLGEGKKQQKDKRESLQRRPEGSQAPARNSGCTTTPVEPAEQGTQGDQKRGMGHGAWGMGHGSFLSDLILHNPKDLLKI